MEAGQYDAALKWLEVALDQLQENPKDRGLNSGNFHLHVRHALSQSCGQIAEGKEIS